MSDIAHANTDREIWREVEGDYYSDSIHVTEQGAIGINCGGTVFVLPARRWHELGRRSEQLREMETIVMALAIYGEGANLEALAEKARSLVKPSEAEA